MEYFQDYNYLIDYCQQLCAIYTNKYYLVTILLYKHNIYRIL